MTKIQFKIFFYQKLFKRYCQWKENCCLF